MTEEELLAGLMAGMNATPTMKLEEPEDEKITFAKNHCGVISASKVATLATYQPDNDVICALSDEIGELNYKIESSTTGKTVTAEKARDTKQAQLDRMLNDNLPDGAVKWAEELAMMRLTGFNEVSDVSFDNKETKWGKDNEPLAVEALKREYPLMDFRSTCENQEFLLLDGFEKVGATPDAVVYASPFALKWATLDIKCPFDRRIHGIDYKNIQSFAQFKRDYPLYYWQSTLQMMCAGVNHFIFASYDPRQTAPNDLFVHFFELVESDAVFLRSRIEKTERLIESIIETF